MEASGGVHEQPVGCCRWAHHQCHALYIDQGELQEDGAAGGHAGDPVPGLGQDHPVLESRSYGPSLSASDAAER